MTRGPNFDELVGGDDLAIEERERLRRVHELLVAAGPPPEVSPDLEAGPDMLATYRNPRRGPRRWSRPLVLVAAALVLLAAFFGGYVSANRSTSSYEFATTHTVRLRATAAAPGALASIRIGERDAGGNWPMKIVADRLPALHGHDYYLVILTRNGKPTAPCGSFIVRNGRGIAYLNAPYKLKGAGWVVTIYSHGDWRQSRVVLTT
jgi:hypothetical protein